MQVAELINNSRSSLPSISATSSYQLPPSLPPISKRISLPPISNILIPLAQQQQQQQQQQPHPQSQPQLQQLPQQQILPAVSHLQQSYSQVPPTSITAANYTTTTNDRLQSFSKSPIPTTTSYTSSNASSVSSPTSLPYHHQYSRQQSSSLPPQYPPHHYLAPPQMIRSNSHSNSFSAAINSAVSSPSRSLSSSSTPSIPSSSSSSSSNTNPNSSSSYSKRKTRNNLPKEITFVLLRWLNDHLNHPYPNSFEKNQLMMSTGLNQQQLSNWFINARRRKIKSLKEQKKMNLV
ncbi:CUP9 [Candida oxycetoniae]|uniref:CUP9 n=1 Tax=Candida oxycetoniae TaxID=497107 RepID=A0AAI9SYV7_9ASCO|nr:CUP9 [Candida oxycetoniae]KAI3405127.2 CUP9 [Candida oxycetoniae]